MTTHQDRADLVTAMLSDPDLHLSPKDIVVTLYYWYKFEIALINKKRASQDCRKWATKLNDQREVFSLRKEMADL